MYYSVAKWKIPQYWGYCSVAKVMSTTVLATLFCCPNDEYHNTGYTILLPEWWVPQYWLNYYVANVVHISILGTLLCCTGNEYHSTGYTFLLLRWWVPTVLKTLHCCPGFECHSPGPQYCGHYSVGKVMSIPVLDVLFCYYGDEEWTQWWDSRRQICFVGGRITGLCQILLRICWSPGPANKQASIKHTITKHNVSTPSLLFSTHIWQTILTWNHSSNESITCTVAVIRIFYIMPAANSSEKLNSQRLLYNHLKEFKANIGMHIVITCSSLKEAQLCFCGVLDLIVTIQGCSIIWHAVCEELIFYPQCNNYQQHSVICEVYLAFN